MRPNNQSQHSSPSVRGVCMYAGSFGLNDEFTAGNLCPFVQLPGTPCDYIEDHMLCHKEIRKCGDVCSVAKGTIIFRWEHSCYDISELHFAVSIIQTSPTRWHMSKTAILQRTFSKFQQIFIF